MRRLISLSCALLALASCDRVEVKREQPHRDTEATALVEATNLTIFAWTDRETGCQYVTTTRATTAQTIPRAGAACPNAALTGR